MPALTRQTFQHGSLTIEPRKNGKDVWVYRWREAGPNGTRVKRKVIVGTVDVLKTKAAAQRAVDGLRLEINAEAPIVASRSLTVGELVAHYQTTELAQTNTSKSPSTRKVYSHFLDAFVAPSWGSKTLKEMRPITVEKWLENLPHAPATRAKIRNLLSALFQHAIRYGWAENNPIRAVRTSAKRLREPDVLTPEEIQELLLELGEPCKTMALLAALTGLRISEILGLQWQDVDLDGAILHLRRGVVNQEISNLKTIASRRPLPIAAPLVNALKSWREQTSFPAPDHWVFASPQTGGQQPFWPGMLLKRQIQPAAKRAGITKQVGWHSFRRSYATLLYLNEQDVKTAQELMRHSNPTVTMGVYAQAVTAHKRQAQERLAMTILQSATEAQLA